MNEFRRFIFHKGLHVKEKAPGYKDSFLMKLIDESRGKDCTVAEGGYFIISSRFIDVFGRITATLDIYSPTDKRILALGTEKED